MRSMRWFLPLAGVLLMAAPLLAAQEAVRIQSLTPDGALGAPSVELLAQSPGSLTLELAVPSVEMTEKELDGRMFQSLELTGGGHFGAVGQPALPTFTRLVALPAGMGVAARVTATDKVDLGIVNLAPGYGIRSVDKMGPVRFDQSLYAAAPASEPAVTVGEPAIMHGMRVVPVTFSPMAYDPATGEAEMARSMTVEIEFSGRDDRNDVASIPAMIPESFATILAEEVVGLDLAGVETGPGSYVMICPNNATVVNIVESLADWRRRQGYNVQVVTTATTGTSNTAIKSWLTTQYNSIEPPLEFVTLVGDANGSVSIPSWRETFSSYNGEGDHDYTTLDGGDVLSDVHLGRLSVTSTSQLQNVVDKIVEYESSPDMSQTNWFTTAGLTGDPASSGYSTIFVNQVAKEHLLDLGYTRIDTIWSGNYLTQMMATINQGESFFTYRGYWNMSGMSSSHIESLGNGQQLPFACILTCDTGSFWDDTTARSEAFLRASNGGGIASIGTATIGTHTRYNNCMFLGVNNGILNSDEHRVGPALTRGKLNLYNNYWNNEWQNVWVWSTWNNLMGDPATEIFTGVPDQISVSYPTQVAVGANALPVTVTLSGSPVEGARVAVYQDGTVRSTAVTGQDGEVVMDIGGAIGGDVLVTVTGTNMYPHLGATAVGTVARSLDFNALVVDDAPGGNGDDLANPGELLDLDIELINHGTNAVTSGAGVLSTSLPYVNIVDGSGSYGTVSAGATAWGDYRIELESDAPGGQTVALRLDATGSGGNWTSLVELPIHGAHGAFNRMTFGGPGGNLDPGESGTVRFDLSNDGDLATSGVTATLSCTSQWISITDGNGGWGSIAAGAAATQADNFSIDISADCLPGHLASLSVAISFAEGGTQVIEFPVTVGSSAVGDPTGPDAYGYYAYDDADTAAEAPTYQWVELAGVGSNTGISDNSRHDDETRSFDLPFPFPYYGDTFDRVSICSNGWLSFGDTYIKLYRNWTLPADGSPDAMICAFWDDLAGGTVYQWYDSANHRYIVQWDAFGSYTGNNYSGNCTFEIILHDPAYYPTDTGDGLIVMQYQSVTVYSDETTYFTTGIQNEARDDGLTYAYGNDYAGGAATVQSNRAIAFRPILPQSQGTLAGSVSNSSDGGAPIEGATVTVLGSGRTLATGGDGLYQGGVTVGTWDIAVYHDSCAPDTTYNVEINEGQTTTVNFALADNRGPYIDNTTQLADTQDTGGPYVVQANVTDLTGVVDHVLHYTSSSSGGPYTLPMTVVDAGTGLVEASIPGQPDGSRIQYWITASDVLGNGSADPLGAPWPNYSFMVAPVTVVTDDEMESAGSWQVNLQGTDTATTGDWEHGDPIGTTQDGNQLQPEFDHTAAPGVNCWFTGQHVPGESSGYSDIDGGATSITSPVYDVSGLGAVEVSYWRWYTNNLGSNPGGGTWLVQVSNDGGSSWSNVESTTASNNAWQQVSFVLNDHYADPSQMRLRFSASDDGSGSLVEAALDDLTISAAEVVSDIAAPTVAVTQPSGGTYGNGQQLNVIWNASDDVGVVHANVWLSLDGGSTYDTLIASGALDDATSWIVDVEGSGSYDCRVQVEVFDGMERSATAVSGAFVIEPGTLDVPMPVEVSLAQNHPNPFNPQTVIVFSLPRSQDASLQIYDVQGKLVRTLVRGVQTTGHHEVTWKGRDDHGGTVASGLYFYRLTTDDGDLVRKMTLLK